MYGDTPQIAQAKEDENHVPLNQSREQPPSIRHYFVDEAVDGTLFDKRGRITVGTEGCSRYTRKKPLRTAALEDLPGI